MIHPEEIRLNKDKKALKLVYQDKEYILEAEFLRVLSPSAEVRGHGVGDETLQTGKKNVLINNIEMVGQYALKIIFDDGHDSGLYTWDYLYQLSTNQQKLWQEYLQKLVQENASREP
ncbi:gamma-butyrobetaine hydroxylase-like domain-containing protein [Neisseria sp. Ec49-e6-T10]|uniref:gamma-butyrobetaine hydroxylase-like domain-containing protein n=1 Tax=Neisseria sp. Ec49-e6-T10 TaxID=3140744 RepID=UPI003EBF5E4E